MQREIEALLEAYLDERNREARVVQDLLTALAIGADARTKMMADLGRIFGQSAIEPRTASRTVQATEPSPRLTIDLAEAISQLRAARDGATAVH